jgi:hypothetical protein
MSDVQWRQTPSGSWQYLASDGNWYEGQRGGAPSGPGQSTNGLAIASFVFGLLWIVGFGALLAVIFAFVSLRQIRERAQGGRGLAIAGMVLGWLGLGGALLFILFGVALAHTVNSEGLTTGTTTISVTGDESAPTSVTIDDGTHETQETGVLPYSTTISGRPFVVSVTAQTQDSSASATVSCEIDETGHAPVVSSSSGAFTVVSCSE